MTAMTIICSINRWKTKPNSWIYLWGATMLFYPSFVGENWLSRRFSSKRKGVLTLHYHTTRLYRGIQLQTTSFRLPNWNISQYFSVNTLPHYKAIQENTTTNYKLQTTKLKHKLILQCKHTTTLKFYNIQRLPWWSVANLNNTSF